MGFWKQPQNTFLRRALFQVHLWTGIAIGLYIVFISVTGSAVVFRRDLLYAKLGNVPAADAKGTRLTDAQLREAVLRRYPGGEITKLVISRRKATPAEVTLTRGSDKIEERFNQYTGADMGEMHPASVAVMEWLVDLHDNLLRGETGRQLNAIGGALTCLLCLTGVDHLVARATRLGIRAFYFNPKQGWKRVNFDLHAALGFWGLAILFLWGFTAIYFAFPEPFNAAVDYLEPTQIAGATRKGDAFLAWMVAMHFGRYGGLGVRITYVVIGLLPAVMFVTGAIMWWNRVLRRWITETASARAAFPRQPTAEPVE